MAKPFTECDIAILYMMQLPTGHQHLSKPVSVSSSEDAKPTKQFTSSYNLLTSFKGGEKPRRTLSEQTGICEQLSQVWECWKQNLWDVCCHEYVINLDLINFHC